MAICDNARRIISIKHGAVSLDQPTGGSIAETVEFEINRPDVVVTPSCVAINLYNLTAKGKFQGLATPIVRGTIDTLEYKLLQFDAGTTTITMLTMVMGAASFDFDTAPYSETYEFQYQGTTMTNITVTP